MSTSASTHVYLYASSVAVSFLATMLAFRSFVNLRPAWGAFNFAIALVALITFIVVRARGDKA